MCVCVRVCVCERERGGVDYQKRYKCLEFQIICLTSYQVCFSHVPDFGFGLAVPLSNFYPPPPHCASQNYIGFFFKATTYIPSFQTRQFLVKPEFCFISKTNQLDPFLQSKFFVAAKFCYFHPLEKIQVDSFSIFYLCQLDIFIV